MEHYIEETLKEFDMQFATNVTTQKKLSLEDLQNGAKVGETISYRQFLENVLAHIQSSLPEEKEHDKYCYALADGAYKKKDCDCGAIHWNSYRQTLLSKLFNK